MARHRGRQGEWAPVKNQPDACFVNANGYFRLDAPVAGPLRMGTNPPVGPKGDAVTASNARRSNFGTDRISPRDFDPLGTTRNRFGSIEADLLAKSIRKKGD